MGVERWTWLWIEEFTQTDKPCWLIVKFIAHRLDAPLGRVHLSSEQMDHLPLSPRALLATCCIALPLATLACAPSPPIVLNPRAVARQPTVPRTREAARDRRCEQPTRAALTEAEKTRLFDEFDGWQDVRRPPGATAAPVPPPAPARNRPAPPGCRVLRN